MTSLTKTNLWKNMAIAGGVLAAQALYLPTALAGEGVLSETVFERALHQDEQLSAHFDVNRELGRAWIDVDLTPESEGEVAQVSEVFNESVNGLYYDAASRQVIYRNGMARAVCAEDASFLWMKSLKETGQCQLRVSSETRKVDDGFHVREESLGKVVLQVSFDTPAISIR
jgi:hypothetical protein